MGARVTFNLERHGLRILNEEQKSQLSAFLNTTGTAYRGIQKVFEVEFDYTGRRPKIIRVFWQNGETTWG